LSKAAKQAATVAIWNSVPEAGMYVEVSPVLLAFSVEFPPPTAPERGKQAFQKLAKQLWRGIQAEDKVVLMRIQWLKNLITECTRLRDASTLVILDRLFDAFMLRSQTYHQDYQRALKELTNASLWPQDREAAEALIQQLEAAQCLRLAQLTRTELAWWNLRSPQAYVDELIAQITALEHALTILSWWNKDQHAPFLQKMDEKRRQQLLDACGRIQEALDKQAHRRALIGKTSYLEGVLKEIKQALDAQA